MNIHLEESVELDAPTDVAWSVVADYERDPLWRTGVETMAPSPGGRVAVGTTTAEILRLGGRTYRNGGVVTFVDPGRRFTWETTSGAVARGERAVEALDDGRSRVTVVVDVTPKPSERLLVPVLRRLLARNQAADVRRLKALVEAEAALVEAG